MNDSLAAKSLLFALVCRDISVNSFVFRGRRYTLGHGAGMS